MSEDEILAEADRRYDTSPAFHARVHATAIILSNRHSDLTGTRLDDVDLDLARHAASVALVLAELNTRGLVKRIDDYRQSKGWNPHGFGNEEGSA